MGPGRLTKRPRLVLFAPYNTPSLWDLPGLLNRLVGLDISVVNLGDPTTLVSVAFPDGNVWVEQGNRSISLDADVFVSLPFNYSPFYRLLKPQAEGFSEQKFITEQWIALSDYIDSFLDQKNWINKPSLARKAANKLIVMHNALQFGLSTPRSIFSNDPQKVVEYLPAEEVLSKVLGYHNEFSKDILLPASKFPKSEIVAAAEEVTSAPACYQELLSSTEQLRFYIFPDEQVCVHQQSHDECGLPDWRFHDPIKMQFTITDNYRDYGSRLASFCCLIGIEYAAIDVLVSGDSLILLDVNPNGTWRWLEQGICDSIQAAFERMLVRKATDAVVAL